MVLEALCPGSTESQLGPAWARDPRSEGRGFSERQRKVRAQRRRRERSITPSEPGSLLTCERERGSERERNRERKRGSEKQRERGRYRDKVSKHFTNRWRVAGGEGTTAR